VTVRGVRLHVAEAGSGDPVVLLHSFPQHWYAWRHVVAFLGGIRLHGIRLLDPMLRLTAGPLARRPIRRLEHRLQAR